MGSASLTTAGSAVEASRAYYAYGAERSATGDLKTDRTFTGQKSDASGLLYYNARYYDPALGTFISPDAIVPDPVLVIDYNRFLYARGNPFKYADPDGHCPKPPEGWGPAICLALFIEPSEVMVGPLTGGGDGRGFMSDSDSTQSRAYVWISLDSDRVEMHGNPTSFKAPVLAGGRIGWFWLKMGPSEENSVDVTRLSSDHGQVIIVSLDLVLAGLPQWASPHINATIRFYTNSEGNWEALWDRDGYPWAEGYYYDGEGNSQPIFQDPAVRGEIYDLAAIEEDTNLAKQFHVFLMNRGKDLAPPVRSQNLYRGGFGSSPYVPHGPYHNRPLKL